MKLPKIIFILLISINTQAQLTISEILWEEPDWDGDLQYIELANFSSDTLNLSDWGISGSINLPFLPNVDLAPNEFYLIGADNLDLIDFGIVINAGWGVVNQIFGDPFFILFGPDSTVEIEYNEDWPVPSNGVSIELCDLGSDASSALNWALSENVMIANGLEITGTPSTINSCTEIISSTNNYAASNFFQIFPNPAHSEIQISDLDQFDYVEIFDAKGVKAVSNKSRETKIDISSLANGLYFMRIKAGNKFYQKRFIKN